MFSLTNTNDDYYCHIKCECGRLFRAEEMYICYNCNKILCRFCLTFEYEFYCCKNNCKRNQYLNAQIAKKRRNCCDCCLECPQCFTPLSKRCNNKTWMYVCPYCYWDTSGIKLATGKENELDILLGQLQEAACTGFLKKIYAHSLQKLKLNQSNAAADLSSYLLRASNRGSFSMSRPESKTDTQNDADLIDQAIKDDTMTLDILEESIARDKLKLDTKNTLSYDDEYLTDSNHAYFIYPLLACTLDYSDTSICKFSSIDALKSKLKNELDISSFNSLQQRHNNLTLQHPMTNMSYPKFIDLIPQRVKSSKKCKHCKKLVIQAGDITTNKSMEAKLEIPHLFLLQFPYITIFKVDSAMKVLLLKFCVLDYKEITISITEDAENQTKVVLPEGKYEIGTNKQYEQDCFFFSKNDKYIVLNFKIKEEYLEMFNEVGRFHVLKFKINAEYNRGGSETATQIEYSVEIKFKS